ncbi:MAG: WD40 repeat domain-containing protein [Gemmataceae bacterium]|nr:WD40 repeat domain-containing protein [Gemmataceae bacterium]
MSRLACQSLAAVALVLCAPAIRAQEPVKLKHEYGVTRVTFSPDGKMLASVTLARGWAPAFGVVRLWDVAGEQELRTLQWKNTSAEAAAFSPDGRLIAVGGALEMLRGQFRTTTGVVRVCEVENGRELFTLAGHTETVTAVAFSADGKFLATSSADQTARLWEVAQGQEVLMLKGHTEAVTCLAFSPDGRRLATGSADRTVRVWDVANGEMRLALRGHTGAISAVAFAPDGRALASAGLDREVRSWDTVTGKERFRVTEAKLPILALGFAPDGRFLAGGLGTGKTGELKVWNATTGKALTDVASAEGRVAGVAFSPDGSRLAGAVIGEPGAPGEVARGGVNVWEVKALLANNP